MSAENRNSLPPCIETPLVIGAARDTDGFSNQSPEAQEAILSFTSVSINLLRNGDEVYQKLFESAWKTVRESGADEVLAIQIALRAAFQLPEELGHQW